MLGPDRRWYSKLLSDKDLYFALDFMSGACLSFTEYGPVNYLYDLDKKQIQTILFPEFLVYTTRDPARLEAPVIGIDKEGQLFGFDIFFSHTILEMLHILNQRHGCKTHAVYRVTDNLPSTLNGCRNVAYYKRVAEIRKEHGEDYVYLY